MNDPWDLIDKASSPGDVATILLAGTLGFTLDAGLNIIGFFSPGHVGITFASTALGAKKAWEAATANRTRRNTLLKKARHFQSRLQREHNEALSTRIAVEIDFVENGLRSLEASERALDELVEQYTSPSSAV